MCQRFYYIYVKIKINKPQEEDMILYLETWRKQFSQEVQDSPTAPWCEGDLWKQVKIILFTNRKQMYYRPISGQYEMYLRYQMVEGHMS